MRKVNNAADRIKVRDEAKRNVLERDIELADLREVLSSKSGRRVFWRFISRCGVFENRWSSSARIHFDQGERNIGLFMLGEVTETDEELFYTMMRENKEKEKNAN